MSHDEELAKNPQVVEKVSEMVAEKAASSVPPKKTL
jgi:hypothetical protein